MKTPRVGIFWLVNGRLVFDTTSLADAEPYGECKGHSRGHIESWHAMQAAGLVSRDTEYEVHPRGRVLYNVETRKFMLLADRCILKERTLVKKIMAELQLPAAMTQPDIDAHYRCYKCLGYEI